MHPFLVTTAAHYSAKVANKGVAAEVVVSYPTGGELGDPNRPNGGDRHRARGQGHSQGPPWEAVGVCPGENAAQGN